MVSPCHFDGLTVTTPFALDLTDRPVVVVGGGPVAAAKIAGLRAGGAAVTVIAPQIGEEVREHGVTVVERPYAGADDLDGAWLAVAATGVADVDDAVVADAEALRLWCVRSGTAAEDSTIASAS